MSTAVANPASEKQTRFIKTLFTEASDGTTKLVEAGQDDVVAAFAAMVKPLEALLVAVLSDQPVENSEASSAITTLIAVNKMIKTTLPTPAQPVGIAAMNPAKVIPNRFPKACAFCGEQVPEGEGFAVLKGTWKTVCQACANTAPEDRAAKVQAATDEKAVLEAQRDALAADLFTILGTKANKLPRANVAVRSATGNNDLDFYKVQTSQTTKSPYVLRVIGGHADQRLSLEQSVKALQQILSEGHDGVRAAAVRYGQELEFCGCCGRHLTDETSRAAGIGPDCAAKYGF